MNLTMVGLMVVAAVVMIVGFTKSKSGAAWGKPVAVIGALLALGLAISNMVPNTGSMIKVYTELARISAFTLGQYVAEKQPQAKVLIVASPDMGQGAGQAEDIILTGLKQGLGTGVTIVAEVRPLGSMIPESLGTEPAAPDPNAIVWPMPESLDKILAPHEGQFDILITTAGLPFEAGKLKMWKWKTVPKIAVAAGSVQELQGPIASGQVMAAVGPKLSAPAEVKSVPRDIAKAFNERFILITPENVAQVAKDNPGLFLDAGGSAGAPPAP